MKTTGFKISTVLKLIGVAILITYFTGCGSKSASFSLLPDSQSFKQNSVAGRIDVLWVVDNSGSMGPLQTNMVANFNSFIQDFTANDYDFQMAVTTSDSYRANPVFAYANPLWGKFRDGTNATSHTGVFVMLPSTLNLESTFVTNATQGANGSGDERVFSSFREALNSPHNTGFVRENSFLAVIILSDEDDFSGFGRCEGCGTDHNYNASTLESVDTYVDYLDTLTNSTGATRRYNVSSIAALDQTCVNQHKTQAPSTILGARYIDLSDKTSGVKVSICDASYASGLKLIANQIASLSTQFYLDRLPIIETIQVLVDGVTVAQDSVNGWSYDMAANSIRFNGTALPKAGASVTINFDPVTIK